MKDKAHKKCAFCEKPLSGRSDKKFCDDSCRNNFHYHLNNDKYKSINNINKILINNRNILHSLNRNGKTLINKQSLAKADFNFDFFTGIYKTSKDNVYFLIYDMAYRFMSDDVVLLVKYY